MRNPITGERVILMDYIVLAAAPIGLVFGVDEFLYIAVGYFVVDILLARQRWREGRPIL